MKRPYHSPNAYAELSAALMEISPERRAEIAAKKAKIRASHNGVHTMSQSPLTPGVRSLFFVANELGRAIDNIATCPWSNSLIPETLSILSNQWHDYHTMISYLTRDSTIDLTHYLITPDHLVQEPSTPSDSV